MNNTIEKKEEVKVARKKTLLEIHREFSTVMYQILNTESEDIPAEVQERYEQGLRELCHKADNYGVVIDQLASFGEQCKHKKEEFAAGERAAKNAQERLKSLMKFVLSQMDEQAVQGDSYRFYLSKPSSRLQIDENLLPKEFKKTVITHVPDKERIEQAVSDGKIIPGVTTIKSQSLRSGRPQ